MDDANPYIVDAPLPEALDFDALKAMGIEHLKQLAGQTWSNFNESDPGVTILDQLCYALTELGYCAEFPIEDVLTGADGQIRYEGQFFTPQDILTCSPVTPDDYRRLVHDRMAAVEAIYITVRILPGSEFATGVYDTWVHVSPSSSDDQKQIVLRQVHTLLNAHRNLGELFAMPRMLDVVQVDLAGSLQLASNADVPHVQALILQTLRAYAVPPVLHRGYRQLRDRGVTADEIFNGPNLSHGWICGGEALPDKRRRINRFELAARLAAVPGVEQVRQLVMTIRGAVHEVFDLVPTQIASITADALSLAQNAVFRPRMGCTGTANAMSHIQARQQAASVEAAVDPYPRLPQGRYRDIEAYYSVQNTFPDVYGIGPNSLQSDAADPRVVSSRQLKGYLLAFDQLLANQFSQLAHVGELFSFAPPRARQANGKDGEGLSYPGFQATYHCQALYDVPDVMPLLRGNQAFHYRTDPQQALAMAQRDAWQRFRDHPGNAYLQGLHRLMESAPEAESRRDRMLSHLMARHGDAASLYDDMFKAVQWYGSDARTRSVVKGIWLENYPHLSYARTRGFNPWAAAALPSLPAPGEPPRYRSRTQSPTVDGQLDEALIRARARLRPADFDNFSAFELKVDILLGLSQHLRALCDKVAALLNDDGFGDWLGGLSQDDDRYALADSDLSVRQVDGMHRLYEGGQPLLNIVRPSEGQPGLQDYRLHLDQLDWLATQRKGLLLIEHPLLGMDEEDRPAWPLSATLVFPEYVSLVAEEGFSRFIQTLLHQHWPAHVTLRCMNLSQVGLRALIGYFVTWHNNMGRPAVRDGAARIIARLLKLAPTGEAADAH